MRHRLYWEKDKDGNIWGTCVVNDNHIVVQADTGKGMLSAMSTAIKEIENVDTSGFIILPIRLINKPLPFKC